LRNSSGEEKCTIFVMFRPIRKTRQWCFSL
jgi:hypothetical protein